MMDIKPFVRSSKFVKRCARSILKTQSEWAKCVSYCVTSNTRLHKKFLFCKGFLKIVISIVYIINYVCKFLTFYLIFLQSVFWGEWKQTCFRIWPIHVRIRPNIFNTFPCTHFFNEKEPMNNRTGPNIPTLFHALDFQYDKDFEKLCWIFHLVIPNHYIASIVMYR